MKKARRYMGCKERSVRERRAVAQFRRAGWDKAKLMSVALPVDLDAMRSYWGRSSAFARGRNAAVPNSYCSVANYVRILPYLTFRWLPSSFFFVFCPN